MGGVYVAASNDPPSGGGGEGGGGEGGSGGGGGGGVSPPVIGNTFIAFDASPVVRGEEVTFWVETESDDWPEFPLVEWDFDYDGTTFQADATDEGNWGVTTTFQSAGVLTIAARVTDSEEVVQIVSQGVTVEPAAPVLTASDQTATAGTEVTLVVDAQSDVPIISVEWWFSYEGEEYYLDENVTELNPLYVFEEAGEYDAWLVATDANGKSGEGWFHISVANATPISQITVSRFDGSSIAGGVDEGTTVRFTVNDLSIDDLDTTTVYVDWTGDGVYDQLNQAGGDFVVDPNNPDMVSFTHRYDDNKNGGGAYEVKIRLEDEWGVFDYDPVPVLVKNVDPVATLSVGGGDPITSYRERMPLYIVTHPLVPIAENLGTNLVLNVTDPSLADTSVLKYHWVITNDNNPGIPAEVFNGETDTNYYTFPSYDFGQVYKVTAWATDKDGSEERASRPFTVAIVEGDIAVSNQNGPPQSVYGGLYVSSPPPLYPRFSPTPLDIYNGWWSGGDLPLTFQLDTPAKDFALNQDVTQIRFNYTVEVWDVERFSLAPAHHNLISSSTYTHLSEYCIGTDTFTVTTGMLDDPNHIEDRQIVVRGVAELIQNDEVIGTSQRVSCPTVVINTQLTNTTLETFTGYVNSAGSCSIRPATDSSPPTNR